MYQSAVITNNMLRMKTVKHLEQLAQRLCHPFLQELLVDQERMRSSAWFFQADVSALSFLTLLVGQEEGPVKTCSNYTQRFSSGEPAQPRVTFKGSLLVNPIQPRVTFKGSLLVNPAQPRVTFKGSLLVNPAQSPVTFKGSLLVNPAQPRVTLKGSLLVNPAQPRVTFYKNSAGDEIANMMTMYM